MGVWGGIVEGRKKKKEEKKKGKTFGKLTKESLKTKKATTPSARVSIQQISTSESLCISNMQSKARALRVKINKNRRRTHPR